MPPLRHADPSASSGQAFKVSATTPGLSTAKPFTREQVEGLVRDGLGDESGAKLIEQRGIDFAPSEDFCQTLKAAGASEAFLKALRTAKPPGSASAKKPLNQVQVFALLAGQVPSHRVTMLVQERGIDFEPTDDYLQEARLAGGEDELISALKSAKVTKPEHVDPALQARQTEVRQHVARAGEFYRGKQYADAEAEFRAALRLAPEDAELHFDLGATLGNKGDWDGEITEERAALRLNPDNDMAHNNLGIALGNKGDRDGEIAEEREALRLNPNNDLAHSNLGLALGKKGEWDAAIAEEREALRLNPNNDQPHFNLGVALGLRHDWDGAITEFREALRLNPNSDAVHEGLGFALEKKGDRRGALEEYHAAFTLDPKNATYKGNYERLSQLNHDDDNVHYNLGVALANKGNWDGAMAEFREALRLNPNNDGAHVALGYGLVVKGDWEGGIAEYREALRLNPKSEMAHVYLGKTLEIKGDWDGEISEERQALRLNPNDAEAHYRLGFALERKTDHRGALEEYRSAFELDPKNSVYREAYERLLKKVRR